MKNLANNHGFVYNVGGEKVEGFTSILWTITGGLIYYFTNHIEEAIFIFNIFIISILLFKIGEFICKINEGKTSYYTATLTLFMFLFLSPGFFFWNSIALMETSLWTLLITLTVLTIFENKTTKRDIKFTILILLMLITRPESYILNIIIIIIKGYYEYLRTDYKRKAIINKNLLIFLINITGLVALISWRLHYFGYPFPNTYYVKVYDSIMVNFVLGFKYVASFVIYSNPLFIILIIIGIITTTKYFIITRKKPLKNTDIVQFIILFTMITGLIIPLYTGGDYFKLGRFIQPFVPISTLLLFNIPFIKEHIIDINIKYEVNRYLKFIIVLLIITIISFLPRERIYSMIENKSESPNKYYIEVTQNGKELAQRMNRFFAPEMQPYSSVIAAGFAHKYNGKCLDLMGLNSVEMAHSPKKIKGYKNHDGFNKEVFFEIEPDIIYDGLPGYFIEDTAKVEIREESEYFKEQFISRALDNLWYDEKFKDIYKPAIIKNKQSNEEFFTYGNVKYLNRLDTNKYKIKYIR